jgi:hypothetical protein
LTFENKSFIETVIIQVKNMLLIAKIKSGWLKRIFLMYSEWSGFMRGVMRYLKYLGIWVAMSSVTTALSGKLSIRCIKVPCINGLNPFYFSEDHKKCLNDLSLEVILIDNPGEIRAATIRKHEYNAKKNNWGFTSVMMQDLFSTHDIIRLNNLLALAAGKGESLQVIDLFLGVSPQNFLDYLWKQNELFSNKLDERRDRLLAERYSNNIFVHNKKRFNKNREEFKDWYVNSIQNQINSQVIRSAEFDKPGVLVGYDERHHVLYFLLPPVENFAELIQVKFDDGLLGVLEV